MNHAYDKDTGMALTIDVVGVAAAAATCSMQRPGVVRAQQTQVQRRDTHHRGHG
jgi:hypothetical protein